MRRALGWLGLTAALIAAQAVADTYSIPSSGGALPSGAIVMIVSGTCPSGTTEESSLDGKTLFGTLASHSDVGGTGGNDNITPAGTNSTSSVTPLGSVAAPVISWPAGVPTFAGSSSTVVVNHLHTLATGTGSTGNFSQVIGTVDTSSGGTGGTPTQTALGTLSGNPTAGGAANYTPAGTISWPAGVPTNTAPTFTGSSSTVGAQTFTGTAFDNRSAFKKVIFCKAD